jgi:hypothetical protein
MANFGLVVIPFRVFYINVTMGLVLEEVHNLLLAGLPFATNLLHYGINTLPVLV